MKKTITLLSFLIFLTAGGIILCISGCSRNDKLQGDWSLIFFSSGQGTRQNTQQDKNETDALCFLCINKSDLWGNSGVNNFRTSFSLKKNNIKIKEPIANTKMAGSTEAMVFENTFLSFLKDVDTWQITKQDADDTLVLKQSTSEKKAVFKRISIEDTLFVLDAINKDGSLQTTDTFAPPTLILSQKQAIIYTGLNTIQQTYTLDIKKHALSFSQKNGIATLVSGSPLDMQIEAQYRLLLEKVANYSIQKEGLLLLDKEGSVILSFFKKDYVD